ncbi:unnamed protein product [Arabis nemorensis]|uniref:Uncharacterized protein n=1 Tax=Arabis nemorensis TaxID=586526 RepID=A0A565C0W6_9BRAS|nr:unnamed protein product [Arabis nemorensis]
MDLVRTINLLGNEAGVPSKKMAIADYGQTMPDACTNIFHLQTNPENPKLGGIVIELFADINPITVENF